MYIYSSASRICIGGAKCCWPTWLADETFFRLMSREAFKNRINI